MRRARVYVAGAYSAGNTEDTFRHMRAGITAALELVERGYAPYTPWTDWPLHLQRRIPIGVCYNWSMAWLEASDAMLVLPDDLADSAGTQMEIKRAAELGIPTHYSMDELCKKCSPLR